MTRAELIKLTAKGLLVWLLLSGLGWYFEEALGNALLPAFGLVIRLLSPDYSSWLHLIPKQHDFMIQLSARNLHPIVLAENRAIPTAQTITTAIDLLHVLVPVIIEFSILLVWPVNSLRARLILILSGIVTALLVVAATGPAILIGKNELFLMEMAEQAHGLRPKPWIVDWMIFSEMGGCWLLPLLAALFCIAVQRQLCAGPLPPPTDARP